MQRAVSLGAVSRRPLNQLERGMGVSPIVTQRARELAVLLSRAVHGRLFPRAAFSIFVGRVMLSAPAQDLAATSRQSIALL